MLNNIDADIFSRISTFREYVEINFEIDEALSMAGFNEMDIQKYPLLKEYYLSAKQKEK
ncbi:MAG: hypothetical protein ABIY35_06515 [Chitinophagaceae bacterium]